MVCFDANVLIYALYNNIDDDEQQNISVKLFEEAVLNKSIILSELILCEFAFTSKKLKEDENTIEQNLKYLSQYVAMLLFIGYAVADVSDVSDH